MTVEEFIDSEAFLDKFKSAERPEWALKPDGDGSLEKALEAVPLFMKTAPSDPNLNDNVQLQALQSLLYDGEPEEVATNFKEQGNEAFRTKNFTLALEYYSRGLEIQGISNQLKATLHGNKSAVSCQINQWSDALAECKKSLRLIQNSRVLSRAFKCALVLLDGLFIKSIYSELSPEDKIKADMALGEYEKIETQKFKFLECQQYLSREYNLTWQKGAEQELLSAFPSLDPASLPTVRLHNSKSVWPVMFLYPKHAGSDFVEDFREDDVFEDQLNRLFQNPPPFAADYTAKDVFLFMHGAYCLYRIHKKNTLSSLFKGCVTHYDRGFLSFYIIHKQDTETIAKLSARYGKRISDI